MSFSSNTRVSVTWRLWWFPHMLGVLFNTINLLSLLVPWNLHRAWDATSQLRKSTLASSRCQDIVEVDSCWHFRIWSLASYEEKHSFAADKFVRSSTRILDVFVIAAGLSYPCLYWLQPACRRSPSKALLGARVSCPTGVFVASTHAIFICRSTWQ